MRIVPCGVKPKPKHAHLFCLGFIITALSLRYIADCPHAKKRYTKYLIFVSVLRTPSAVAHRNSNSQSPVGASPLLSILLHGQELKDFNLQQLIHGVAMLCFFHGYASTCNEPRRSNGCKLLGSLRATLHRQRRIDSHKMN